MPAPAKLEFTRYACSRVAVTLTNFFTPVLRGLLLLLVLVLVAGCRAVVPIHVWQPPQVTAPPNAKLALAPVAGQADLARRIEQAMLEQRPSSSADVAIFTSEQLVESSPVRLASTTPLNNDSLALAAARQAGADLLLQGEVLSTDLSQGDLLANSVESQTSEVNMNQLFFQRLNRDQSQEAQHRILISWRVLDVRTAKTLGAQAFTLHSRLAAEQYPDLATDDTSSADLLIAATARETWKAISPVVVKEKVRLARPWIQPGAWSVRRGVRAAKKGKWQEAEATWKGVVDRYGFSAAAHHNLAVAMAAREDFDSAKQELSRATGLLAFRLPNETLFWLDQKHQQFHQAHGLPIPVDGWAFAPPQRLAGMRGDATMQGVDTTYDAPPVDVSDLPWWTAIPLAKPPAWSWKAWLSQLR
ncbi:MAG: hypothetical protein R3C53_05165 [Pirellulaceae bacterium]